MSITDELREWMDRTTARFDGRRYLLGTDEELTAIADRIDVAHKEAYDAAYQDGENAILAVFDKRGNADVDKTMAEHGWYRALDADKKPIHLGDEVYQVEGGWVYTVKSISFNPDNTTVTFECKHGFGNDSAHNLRHYHEPTVEDVLHDFICDHEEGVRDEVDLIAEYAAKLRLAGDAE